MEYVPDLSGQRERRKRLLDKVNARFKHTVVLNGVVRVTGHEENFNAWNYYIYFIGQFTTIDARHDHIGKDKIYVSLFSSQI